jgi:predicted Holliday junction resolvase-like endonuclease
MSAMGIKILSYVCIALLITQTLSGFYIHHLHKEVAEEKQAKELAQKDLKKCQDDKILSEEKAEDHAEKITTLNSRIAELKRLRVNPRCIPITR